jgi:hypothetical protein
VGATARAIALAVTQGENVSTPTERTRALTETKSFLLKLSDPTRQPRVPKSVREHAEYLLRHYPAYANLEAAHIALPDLYASVHPPRLLEDPLQPDVGDKQ